MIASGSKHCDKLTAKNLILAALLGCGFFVARAQAVAPPNDNFANRTDVNAAVTFAGPSIVYSTAGLDTTQATFGESGYEQAQCSGGSFSVWYQYLATTTLIGNFNTQGSNYDTVIAVWKQVTSATPQNIVYANACNDDYDGNTSRINNLTLSKGTTYFFQISRYNSGGSAGTMIFSASMTPVAMDETPPTVQIQKPATGSYPSYGNSGLSLNIISGTAADNHSLSQVQIRISSNVSFDWDGSTWVAPTVWLNAYLNDPGSNSSAWSYSNYIALQNGVTHFVQVKVFDSSGNYTVAVSSFYYEQTPLSLNENPPGFGAFFPQPYTYTGNNSNANQALYRTPTCTGGNRDVWFLYRSTVTGAAALDTFGSEIDTVLAVYTSTGNSNGIDPQLPDTEIACNDQFNGNQSKVTIPLTAGATYVFQVFSWSNSPSGGYKFNLNLLPDDPTPPARIGNLTANKGNYPGSVQLLWTSVGDDGNSGTAQSYEIRYTTAGPFNNPATFSTGTFYYAPTPTAAGSSVDYYLWGLPERTTVWAAIKVFDDFFNSSLSNSATVYVPGTPPSATNLSQILASTVTSIPYADELTAQYSDTMIAGDLFPQCKSIPPSTYADVWYKFVSTASGVNLVANSFNSNMDTVMQVWQDTGGFTNKSQFVPVTCNDDAFGFNMVSKVSMPNLTMGGTYFVQVAYPYSGTLKFQIAPADSVNPGQVTGLTATPGTENGEVLLSWTEPADNGNDAASGRVNRYFVRYSSLTAINNSNWSNPYTSTGAVLDIEAMPLYLFPPTPISVGNPVSYTIRNLQQGVTYYFAVRSQDQAGNMSNASNSPFARAKAPIQQQGDGEGVAQLRAEDGVTPLTSVPVSSQVTVNIRFTVGASSITTGGKIIIRFPDFWTAPNFGSPGNPGYITISSITPTVNISTISSGIDIYTEPGVSKLILTAGNKLNPGDIINIRYQNAWTPYNKQNGVQFQVKSQAGSGGLPVAIAAQPSVNIVAGVPMNIGFTDWNFLTLGAGQHSPELIIEPKDNSWQTAVAHKSLKLRVFAVYYDTVNYQYRYDDQAQFSKDNFVNDIYFSSGNVSNNLLIPTAAVQVVQWNQMLSVHPNATYYNFIIPAGSSGEGIFYRSSKVGNTQLWIEYNNDFDAGPSTYTTSRGFQIRSGVMGFNGLAASPATITPDGDNSGDFATIQFTPTINDAQWRVRIGSDVIFSQLSPLPNTIGGGGFGGAPGAGVSVSSINVFLDFWGNGQPQSINWYGSDNMGAVLPDGTYIVRVEDVGGAAISTTTVVVDTGFIDVFVKKPDTTGASNAYVSANGQSGSGYVYRYKQTDGQGRARIWGLKQGSAYSLSANYYDSAVQNNFNGNLNNQTANSDPAAVSTITFSFPAQIRIRAAVSTSAIQNSYDQWGSVNVADAQGLGVGYGSLRIPAGSAESDSGWSYTGFPSSWTTINVLSGNSYKIRVEIYGYSPQEINTGSLSAGLNDFTFNLIKKPKIMGYVILPATQAYGTWVSIEGTKSGNNFPTVWGGAYVQGMDQGSAYARTTGTYIVDVDTGIYTFKARAFGLGTTQHTSITIGANGIGTLQSGDAYNGTAVILNGLDFRFSTPSAGITGTITVNGNTGDLQSWQIQNTSFTLYINAFSPINYSYANTQVQIATHPTTGSASFSMPGLEDGLYQMYTYLEGFEIDPPGPKTVVVTNGVGSINLTLKKNAGQVAGIFNISPNNDFHNITYSLSGNISSTTVGVNAHTGTSGIWTFRNLGTGFYDVSAFYKTNGQYGNFKVNVINGQVSTVTFNLNSQVFNVTGTIKVQAFTYGATVTSTGTRIESVTDLVGRTGTESIYIGTGNVTLPIIRIEAYPKEFSTFGRGVGDLVAVGAAGNTAGFGVTTSRFTFGQLRYGIVSASGTWTIDNLPPGVYALRHPVNLDPSANYYNTAVGGSFETNGPDVANEQKIIQVSSSGGVIVLDPPNGNLEFTYTAGSEVSGRILLPSDIASDTRFLTLMVQNKQKEIVAWQGIYLNGNSANYRITNLNSGEYTIVVNDERKGSQTNPDQYAMGNNFEKYVAKPLRLKVTGGNLANQNIQLLRSGYMEGKLAIVRISSSGVKSTELIASNNVSLLPNNFRIRAFADSISGNSNFGGDVNQTCTGIFPNTVCTLTIDSVKGTFLVTGLYPDTDLRLFIGQDNYGSNLLGQGKLNVVSIEKRGLQVGAGQTLDLGTIELQLGLTVSGAVTDLGGQPIPNIRIISKAAGKDSHDNRIETFTDSKGSYTISGLDPDQRYYDIIYGARDSGDSGIYNGNNAETRYAQKVKSSVDVRKATAPIDVSLELGLGSITGTITTADGKPLSYPFSDQLGFPAAAVIANKQGDVPTGNPIGDIETRSDINGSFTLDRLSTGTYDVYFFSVGYAVKKTSVSVAAGAVSLNVTLNTGLELSGDISKSDGTKPVESELNTILAASADFSEIVIGANNTNGNTGTIDGYSLAGLKSGTTYTIMFFSNGDDIIVPPESVNGVWITTNTSNFNLTYAQSAPQVYLKGSKTGVKVGNLDQYKFEFESSQALRNKTLDEKSDNYWQQVVTIQSSVGGAGTLSTDPNESNSISANRKKVTVLYVPASDTTKITLRFKSPTDQLQPGTSLHYTIDQSFAYFLGLDGQKIAKINTAQGGSINIDGDSSGAQIPAGAFTDSNGNPLSVSSSVSVGMQKAGVSIGTSVVSAAPSFGTVESNLPPVMLAAIESMTEITRLEHEAKLAEAAKSGVKAAGALTASQVASNVLGAFYDIFLPAGVNRTLSKNAKVTLSYSSSTANPNDMNVYFYNDSNSTMTTTSGQSVPPGAYGIENSSKVVDTANNTISVTVNHFTVYVVVNATSAVLGAGVTVNSGGGTSGTFTKGQVNIINLTAGTTFTLNAIPVSGGLDENHQFTLISTGANNAGIIMNVQSVLKVLNVAVNQESLVDLNDDGMKDVSVVVSGVAGNIATVRVAAHLGVTVLEGADYTGAEMLAFNFPNPFDPTRQGFLFTANRASGGPASASVTGATAIRYALPASLGAVPVGVTLEIFDVSGDLVKKLDFGTRATGKYHYGDWDGRNEGGEIVASGIYIARLAINGAGKSKIFKMAVVK